MQTKVLCLLTSLFLFSCVGKEKYQNAETFSLRDFKSVKELRGRTLEFDSLVMNPTDVRVYDSLLVTLNSGSGKLFHVFNLNTGKQVNQCISKGQGPDEMLMPRFVGSDKEKVVLVDLATSKLREYAIADFAGSASPVPQKQMQLDGKLFICADRLDGRLLGCSYRPDYQLAVFDEAGKKQPGLIPYPQSTLAYSDTERMDAFYMKFVAHGKDRLALCYSMTDLIEIYTADGTLQKRLHGPEQFFAYFKEVHRGKVVTSSPDPERLRDAYFSPRDAGNVFLVLYNGGAPAGESYSALCHHLFGFSWEGDLQTRYLLDQGIFAFDVDAERRKIYGISNEPEYHIVEFDY